MFLCRYCLFFRAFNTDSDELNWALAEILRKVHDKECEAQRKIREYGERLKR